MVEQKKNEFIKQIKKNKYFYQNFFYVCGKQPD